MSLRQIKKVARLEEEILDCMVSIHGLEEIIRSNSEEIDHIKRGGERRHREIDSEAENVF
jgi:DNA integrity scanning protein DisA with diadenylate cyclase activity